jgi:hypothetical protein
MFSRMSFGRGSYGVAHGAVERFIRRMICVRTKTAFTFAQRQRQMLAPVLVRAGGSW